MLIHAADACGVVACASLLAAALHDLATRTVPNRLVAVLAVAGLGLAVLRGDLGWSLLACVVVLLLAAIAWWRGVMGGGDAKLLAAAALAVPPAGIGLMLAATAMAGGIVSLAYVPGRRLFPPPGGKRPAALLARVIRCERRRLSRRGPLPYAVAIAGGAIFTLFGG